MIFIYIIINNIYKQIKIKYIYLLASHCLYFALRAKTPTDGTSHSHSQPESNKAVRHCKLDIEGGRLSIQVFDRSRTLSFFICMKKSSGMTFKALLSRSSNVNSFGHLGGDEFMSFKT